MTLLVMETVQVTKPPPPLPEPLHWSTVTGRAEVSVDGATSHWTRMVAPPPLPDPLHWLIVALVVSPIGLHDRVGWVPPPVPESLHWLMVAGVGEASPVMLLMMWTFHVNVPPPPLPEPSHWVTWVVRWL
jgi:hypothetical protein